MEKYKIRVKIDKIIISISPLKKINVGGKINLSVNNFLLITSSKGNNIPLNAVNNI